MSKQPALLTALIGRQRKDALSDAQIAALLGISRELWNKTRREEMAIGQAVLQGTMKAFPELAAEVLSFLRQNGTIMPDSGIDTTREEVA